MNENHKQIIAENKRRNRQLFPSYNPITGEGSFVERQPLQLFPDKKEILLPAPFFSTELVRDIQQAGSIPALAHQQDRNPEKLLNEFNDLRKDYDFEFWAATTVKIEDKKTRKMVPFVLRVAQRKLLWELEKMRLAGDPIRLILLKARQWGGSTLVQIYMAWIQVCKRTRWHSAIVAEDENQARNIRNMYTRLARHYPGEAGSITFTPYEGSSKNRMILERGSIVGIGSINKPDSLRSFSFMMLHLSEVGVWKSTPQRSAENLMQSLRGMVELDPYTIIVMESTAKGVGNLFHREWQQAQQGTSLYVPFFVAWWEIEIYRKPVEDPEAFIRTWDAYEWELWELGATIEGIKWYRMKKRGENYDDWRMKEEYPSTPEEAFQSSGRRVFHPSYVLNARKTISEPKAIGELYAAGQKGKQALQDIEFGIENEGNLRIWQFPDDLKVSQPTINRFCAFVDVGGRSEESDYSVVSVFDRYWMMEGGLPERVATWRGHLDQDLFAWKAAQIAK
nr:hypothetical protein 33 [Balneolaceae bacterium]